MNCLRFVIILSLCCTFILVESRMQFTNVKCISYNQTFAEFAYCFIKAVNRTYKYISMKAILHQIPINDTVVRGVLLKRYNGYKPFLYNITVDACAFLKNRKKYPIADYFFSHFDKNSNFMHPCPYNHDVQMDRVSINEVEKNLKLPMPKGEYCLETHWTIRGQLRASVRVFINYD